MVEEKVVRIETAYAVDRSDDAIALTLHREAGDPLVIALSAETCARALGQMRAALDAIAFAHAQPVDIPRPPERVTRFDARGEWTLDHGPLALIELTGDRGSGIFGQIPLAEAKALLAMLSAAVALLDHQAATRQ